MNSFQNAGRSTLQNTEVKRAITKGLYGVDINELEKKQQVKRMYQQQLKKQAQQVRRRKAEEKQKQRLQDEKFERKMEIERKKQESQKLAEKNKKLNQNNQINQTNDIQKAKTTQKPQQIQSLNNSNVRNTQIKQPDYSFQSSPIWSQLKSNFQVNATPSDLNPLPKNIYSLQDDRNLYEQQQFKIKKFKQSLDQKVEQVYRQIQSSKNMIGNSNSIIDDIRRRLRSNSYMNQDYNEMQKSGIKQFEEEFSQFYKIPKKTNDFMSGSRMKNLDYQSQSRYQSSLKNMKSYERLEDSAYREKFKTEKFDGTEYDNKPGKWGNQRAKNFLGNREALDYQTDSLMNNIDNILENQNRNQQ